MSLIYDAIDKSKPQAHAIVIGVGEYPYLLGGASRTDKANNPTMGLGQLTSPPISARAFADWLIANMPTNGTPPLGSVELLISSPSSPAAPAPVERATMAAIEAAFDRWEARCDTSEGNVAIFYFCGHGLEKYKQTFLLTEEFGKKQNYWDDGINLMVTGHGMTSCKAATQCYFIDTCRQVSPELIQGLPEMSSRALKSPDASSIPSLNALILKACLPGGEGTAASDSVSDFTKALIRCLQNLGAAYHDGCDWKLTTESLATAMENLMKRTKLPGNKRGSCGRDGESHSPVEILNLTPPIKVLANVYCSPREALSSAALVLRRGSDIVEKSTQHSDWWELEVEPGKYSIEATFPSGSGYTSKVVEIDFRPPYSPAKISVLP